MIQAPRFCTGRNSHVACIVGFIKSFDTNPADVVREASGGKAWKCQGQTQLVHQAALLHVLICQLHLFRDVLEAVPRRTSKHHSRCQQFVLILFCTSCPCLFQPSRYRCGVVGDLTLAYRQQPLHHLQQRVAEMGRNAGRLHTEWTVLRDEGRQGVCLYQSNLQRTRFADFLRHCHHLNIVYVHVLYSYVAM